MEVTAHARDGDPPIHTAAGQAAVRARYGAMSVAEAGRLVEDNVRHSEVSHLGGDLVLHITARVDGAVVLCNGNVVGAEELQAAHPFLGARSVLDLCERLEVGAFPEEDAPLGNLRSKDAREREPCIRFWVYETRPAGGGPFVYQYDSVVRRNVVREPACVVPTNVYSAEAEWDEFLQLERVASALTKFAPQAAGRLLGGAAVLQLTGVAGPDAAPDAAPEGADDAGPDDAPKGAPEGALADAVARAGAAAAQAEAAAARAEAAAAQAEAAAAPASALV